MDRRYNAEFIATAILVFAGCGAIVVETLTGALGHSGVALTWGFIVVALIYTFGHISGAHMNPAVTISFYAIGEFKGKDLLGYIAAQILGAIVGSALLYLLFIEVLASKNFNCEIELLERDLLAEPHEKKV